MNKEKNQTPFCATGEMIYGCMGLGGGWSENPICDADIAQANAAIDAALDGGIRIFDHADIYTFGKAEEVFGKILKERPELKDQIELQSKCGIRFEDELGPKRYDFSREWISNSVEGSLTRLGVEQLDVLLLHRPDPLMEIGELCQTLESLHEQGKVAHFGVSNMHWHQIDYIDKQLNLPLVANQLELSLGNLDWLEEGLFAANPAGKHVHSSQGTLEYCQQNGVRLQAWGCLAQGLYSGRSLDGKPASVTQTASLVEDMARRHDVSREAIVLAWLMRHPAAIQPVIGTTNPQRIAACCEAVKVQLSREDWYALYVSARGAELP